MAATAHVTPDTPAARLRARLESGRLLVTPSCGDALSARLIEDAGFDAMFMSGFAVSAHRIGAPDTGLISYGEMRDAVRDICATTRLPVLADGDTGYGNAMNVRRTVTGYARAGAAAVMIEDQLAPKRCGHTKGKLVVDRAEAVNRIRAADDARRDGGHDILIIARTDARHGHGLDEALARAEAFHDAGADILFVEAPHDEAEMRRICTELPGWKMANMVEGGATPILPPGVLAEIGYHHAAYPLTLMSAAIRAMQDALEALRDGRPPERLSSFDELRRLVGFDDYYQTEQQYSDRRPD
ncbi:2-methylisocitrate lyase-like PEP mutase family enzyme [Roseovarius halotolerans]|uniref:2,3-dimethylmalate lyase n=1 Tax=Roseovarius halotolerans TaxID=505353 RepID=A0A1X6YEJ5_9RHOB|nr:isocitrate lyase/PEP mutase family protein [Roseovarius halotolerans]RKT34775.1 2-methylisocitrate lyase-like PEP mutase family enzyme [Roseovarius halotolerans]SLN18900.1 2,3-dimethylmalate lyase [Roseovarius halotolerans]